MIEWFKTWWDRTFLEPARYSRAYESWELKMKTLQIRYGYARQDLRELELRDRAGDDVAYMLEEEQKNFAQIKQAIHDSPPPDRSRYVYRRLEM